MVKKTLKRKKKVKKNNNIEHINRTRRRRSRYISHGGNIQGNNIRQLLVNLCKTNQWDKYNELVTYIIQNEQVRKNLFHHLDNKIHTFSQETLKCLEHFFEKLETELVDGAYRYRYHSGSDIRQLLVNLCKTNQWDKYDKLVTYIIQNEQVRKNLYDHLDNNIHTFSQETLKCLEHFFEKLETELVDGAYRYHSGSDIRQLLVNFFEKDKTKYSKLVSIIKKEKYVRNKLYDHLDNQIHTFSENTLNSLESCFTELQEEAVEGSDKYTFYIVQNRKLGISNKPIDDYNKSYPTTNTTT